MRNLLILLLLPALCAAQNFPFVQEFTTIPVTVNHWNPFVPWMLGMSWSSPSFGDLDNDGDQDLLVGDFFQNLYVFENTGNLNNAQYIWGDQTCIPYDTLEAYVNPEFCDMDGDGDQDLLLADMSGVIHYYNNQSTPGHINFVLAGDSLTGSGWTYRISACDIDADGDLDLFAGIYDGHIGYYENTGTPSQYNYNLVTYNFANVNTGSYANPTFCDIDADGDYDLFVGNGYGNIYFYRNMGTPQNYNFTLVSSSWQGVSVGSYASPEFCDIDGDGDYDLFVGREPYSGNSTNGDVFYYKNIGTPTAPAFQLITGNYLTMDVGQNAIEQLIDIDADGKLDLFASSGDNIRYYHNNGTAQSPSFTLVSTQFQGIVVNDIQPFFCDLDGDGDYDLVAGTSAWPPAYPALQFYINRGTRRNPNLVFYTSSIAQNNYYVIISPTLADIDADGDLDLFVSDDAGDLYFYRNIGTAQRPRFQFVTQSWQGIFTTSHRYIRFFDIDNDGDLDLFIDSDPYGNQGLGSLSYYENVGTPQQAQMVLRTIQYLPTGASVANAWFCDIDNDSLTDLFVGEAFGGILYFHGTNTLVAGNKPLTTISLLPNPQFNIGPNPANPLANICLQLPTAQNISLGVFNLQGQLVKILASGVFPAGVNIFNWNASTNASGTYFVRLQTPDQVTTRPVVVVK
jgi:hypothetical protein